MTFKTNIDYEFGDNIVLLSIEYDYAEGRPATSPSYSSGGDPADPAECDVRKIEWALLSDPYGNPLKFKEWHPIPEGPLFDLIANEDRIYTELCDHAETLSEDA